MSYMISAPHQSVRTTRPRATLPGRGTRHTTRERPPRSQTLRGVGLREETGFRDRPLGAYSDQIHPYSLLTPVEECSLGEASLRGDQEARDRLVLANVRLVIAVARDFLGRGLSMDDLVGEGNLGLLRAAQDYDPGFGVRFSTYASYWIRESILRALRTTTAPIRLPVYLISLLSKWHRLEQEMSQRCDAPPNHDQIAASLGLSPAQKEMVEYAIRASRCHVGSPSEEDNAFSEAVATVDQPEARLDQQESLQQLRQGLSALAPIEREVLTLRFGLNDEPPRTLGETGQALGLSRDRVRKLEARALRNLKRGWQDSKEGCAALVGAYEG